MLDTIRPHEFLFFLNSFRYPLAGEFALTADLARSLRVVSDWGIEIGSLAEVWHNAEPKHVCQVDLCQHYDHKHQDLSKSDPNKGLSKMVLDILGSWLGTLSSKGVVFDQGLFATLQQAYRRNAQDAIRQYSADALVNGLTEYDRHGEEMIVDTFAPLIGEAGRRFLANPIRGQEMPNWVRVLSAWPGLPDSLRKAVAEDREEFG